MKNATKKKKAFVIPKRQKHFVIKEVADYVRKSVKTIYNSRSRGEFSLGIRSGRNGQILYTRGELDTYLRREVRRN